MNIGLSYMTQIRGGEDTGQLIGDLPDDDQTNKPLSSSLGGWIALTFNQLVSSLTASYHKEHNSDDTHSVIHCTSISEHGRSVASGEWIAAPFATNSFAGAGAMTVVVPVNGPATPNTYAYTVCGKTMTLALMLDGVSIAGTPNVIINVAIPGGYRSVRRQAAACYIVDNGTAGHGFMFVGGTVAIGGTTVGLELSGGPNWTASAANTAIYGTIAFEVL